MTTTSPTRLRTIDDVDVAGKRVLVRVDFNVPLKDGEILDDRRIRAAVPTIRDLLERKAAVILVTHLGRPKNGPEPAFSTAQLRDRVADLVGQPVAWSGDVVGPEARELCAHLAPGQVALLENVRFEAGETKNDDQLSDRLAELADLYCNDAFGSAHRAHCSTEGIAHRLPAVAGRLMAREIEVLGALFENPAPPVVAILGGSKISSKLGVITNLQDRVDSLFIGGAMACTLLRAQGRTTGTSLVEDDQIEVARTLLAEAGSHRARIELPRDAVVVREATAGAERRTVPIDQIPEGWMMVDVGDQTVAAVSDACRGAGTIIWNGPLGIYEIDEFAVGTRAVARAVADSDATSVIGGGDLAAAVEAAGVADRITHVSTGGGATLEYLEGRQLPGVTALVAAG